MNVAWAEEDRNARLRVKETSQSLTECPSGQNIRVRYLVIIAPSGDVLSAHVISSGYPACDKRVADLITHRKQHYERDPDSPSGRLHLSGAVVIR